MCVGDTMTTQQMYRSLALTLLFPHLFFLAHCQCRKNHPDYQGDLYVDVTSAEPCLDQQQANEEYRGAKLYIGDIVKSVDSGPSREFYESPKQDCCYKADFTWAEQSMSGVICTNIVVTGTGEKADSALCPEASELNSNNSFVYTKSNGDNLGVFFEDITEVHGSATAQNATLGSDTCIYLATKGLPDDSCE